MRLLFTVFADHPLYVEQKARSGLVNAFKRSTGKTKRAVRSGKYAARYDVKGRRLFGSKDDAKNAMPKKKKKVQNNGRCETHVISDIVS